MLNLRSLWFPTAALSDVQSWGQLRISLRKLGRTVLILHVHMVRLATEIREMGSIKSLWPESMNSRSKGPSVKQVDKSNIDTLPCLIRSFVLHHAERVIAQFALVRGHWLPQMQSCR